MVIRGLKSFLTCDPCVVGGAIISLNEIILSQTINRPTSNHTKEVGLIAPIFQKTSPRKYISISLFNATLSLVYW